MSGSPSSDVPTETAGPTPLYVVWRRYQGRVDSMQDWFGYAPRYLGSSSASRWGRPFEYAVKALATWAILLRHRPREVWMQIPPTPLLVVGALYKWLRRDVVLIADCHNPVFRPPWIWTPGLRWLLNEVVDVALVHNSHVHRQALAFGVREERCVILETRPATPSRAAPAASSDAPSLPRPTVLFAAGFDADEPIDALVAAARALPHVTFMVTGDTRRAGPGFGAASLPSNVVPLGWVDSDRYKGLVRDADVILGLTLLEGVQLSVANEAVGYGKALILSDTKLLRELFSRGAVYVSNTPEAIADGVRTALRNKDSLESGVARLRGERLERWTGQARVVRARLARG